MREFKQKLLICFEVVTYGGLLLLVPSAVAGLFFQSILIDVLAFVVIGAAAGTVVLTAIALYEGWYLDHLADWGADRHRVEPGMRATSPPPTDDVNQGNV